MYGNGERLRLRYDEIGGATASGATLTVHTFPLHAGCCGAPARRQADHTLRCASVGEAEEQRAALLRNLGGGAAAGPGGGALPRRHLLVLLNPFSGTRKARQHLAATRHILTMRGATLEEVETTHAGHADSMMLTLDLDRYDGIVIVSGDGLVYEVINGLMKREDGAAAVGRMPIGILPAGTGNGLAKSLLCALLAPEAPRPLSFQPAPGPPAPAV